MAIMRFVFSVLVSILFCEMRLPEGDISLLNFSDSTINIVNSYFIVILIGVGYLLSLFYLGLAIYRVVKKRA
jgi:hypothetical protein